MTTTTKEARAVRASKPKKLRAEPSYDLGPPNYTGTYWEGAKEWSDWLPEGMHRDKRARTASCSPTYEERIRRWDIEAPDYHIRTRGACRGCDWIGPERTAEADHDHEGASWFDSLDHVFPGWRATPALVWPGWSSNAKAPCYMSGKPAAKVAKDWTDSLLARGYPREWVGRADAPTRFMRPASDPHGGRAVISRYGPWDNLAVFFPNPAVQPQYAPAAADQEALDFDHPTPPSDRPAIERELIVKYAANEDDRDDGLEMLSTADLVDHLAFAMGELENGLKHQPPGPRRDEMQATLDEVIADAEQLLETHATRQLELAL